MAYARISTFEASQMSGLRVMSGTVKCNGQTHAQTDASFKFIDRCRYFE